METRRDIPRLRIIVEKSKPTNTTIDQHRVSFYGGSYTRIRVHDIYVDAYVDASVKGRRHVDRKKRGAESSTTSWRHFRPIRVLSPPASSLPLSLLARPLFLVRSSLFHRSLTPVPSIRYQQADNNPFRIWQHSFTR